MMVSDATMAKGVVGSFLSVNGREIVSLTSWAYHPPRVMTPLQTCVIGFLYK